MRLLEIIGVTPQKSRHGISRQKILPHVDGPGVDAVAPQHVLETEPRRGSFGKQDQAATDQVGPLELRLGLPGQQKKAIAAVDLYKADEPSRVVVLGHLEGANGAAQAEISLTTEQFVIQLYCTRGGAQLDT